MERALGGAAVVQASRSPGARCAFLRNEEPPDDIGGSMPFRRRLSGGGFSSIASISAQPVASCLAQPWYPREGAPSCGQRFIPATRAGFDRHASRGGLASHATGLPSMTEAPTPGDAQALVKFHALSPLEAVVAGRLANLGTAQAARTDCTHRGPAVGPGRRRAAVVEFPQLADPIQIPRTELPPDRHLEGAAHGADPPDPRSERARPVNQLERNDEMTGRTVDRER